MSTVVWDWGRLGAAASVGRLKQGGIVPALGWLFVADALLLSCFMAVSIVNAYRRPISERSMHLTTTFLLLAALGVTGGMFWLVTHPHPH